MTTSHETFDELAAVYAVGALDGDDLRRFEAHLAEGCERCALALREGHEALARVALAGTPAIPPPAVKVALLRRVAAADRRPVPTRSRASWVPWAAATAAVAVVTAMLTGGLVASRYEARLGLMARETAAVRERLQRDEAALREQMALYRGVVELLRDPATRVVDLQGTGPSLEATGRMIWHEQTGGQLFVANLPPAPAGKAYELWTLGGPAPQPAGLFQVDASGRATHRVKPVAGPLYMIGIGPPPTYTNIEALQGQYYAQCLQAHIEAIEVLLDKGLGLGPGFGNQYGTEFDLDGLLRMDSKTRAETASAAVKSGTVAPNEARRKWFDLGPTPGGETPYMQEQQWPLAHLAARPLPGRPVTPPEEIEPLPPVPDEAEAKRLRAIRLATREFRRLAAQERDAHAKLH